MTAFSSPPQTIFDEQRHYDLLIELLQPDDIDEETLHKAELEKVVRQDRAQRLCMDCRASGKKPKPVTRRE